ncbi:penicillin-binding protein [Methylorubrum sp. SB2]|uniref:penicillin-binding protein n=1 Tax=Methylorubrum subtropicum TaxID=3138812 RepID=UPI00313D2B14
MAARPTRRVVLAVVLSAVATPPAARAARPDPLAAAIRRARLADSAHRQAGRDTLTAFGPDAPRPTYWRAYRSGVLAERYSARRALHALTPATADEASALVAYYAERAELSGDPDTARHARRRLRKVFARPGAPPAPPLPPALKPPAPS